MGIVLRILVMLIGLGLIVRVTLGIRKGRLSEWQAMMWLVAAVVIVILGAVPSIVTWAAGLLGVYWAPSIVFLAAIVLIAAICFNHTKEISVMRAEISEQAMQIALLKDRISQIEHENDSQNRENKA